MAGYVAVTASAVTKATALTGCGGGVGGVPPPPLLLVLVLLPQPENRQANEQRTETSRALFTRDLLEGEEPAGQLEVGELG